MSKLHPLKVPAPKPAPATAATAHVPLPELLADLPARPAAIVAELRKRLPGVHVVEFTGKCVGPRTQPGPPMEAEGRHDYGALGQLPRFVSSRDRAPSLQVGPEHGYVVLYSEVVYGAKGLPDVARYVYFPADAQMTRERMGELYDLSSTILLFELLATVHREHVVGSRIAARQAAEAASRARIAACEPPPRPLNTRRPIRQV